GVDVAPDGDVGNHTDAAVSGDGFDPLVEIRCLDNRFRSRARRPRPWSGGAAATLTTSGHRGTSAQSNSVLSARRELTEHTATRDSLNKCTIRTVADGTSPRTTAM